MKELAFLSGELKAIKEGMASIEAFAATPAASCGRFGVISKDFLPTSKALVTKIEGLFQKAQGLYGDLITYFGESDPSVSQKTLAEFFGVLHNFGVAFEV